MAKQKIPKNMGGLERTVHQMNQNNVAHIVSHVLLGFTFAHLISFFPFLIVTLIFALILIAKEFLIDHTLYHKTFNDEVIDAFEYVVGYIMFIVYLSLLQGYWYGF